MHQAWPKFVARMHKGSPDGGVAVTLWGPANTTVSLLSGGSASVAVDTDYPFGDTATVTVTALVGTPVWLRIPGWATDAVLCIASSVGGRTADANTRSSGCTSVGSHNGTFVIKTQQSPVSTYAMSFNPRIRVSTGFWNSSAAVYRGALLYALLVGENRTVVSRNPFNSTDFTVEVRALALLRLLFATREKTRASAFAAFHALERSPGSGPQQSGRLACI